MTLQEFRETLKNHQPPGDLDILLQAMWHDAKDDWDTAHTLAQDVATDLGSWVHAYLHRKEGDPGNASYWYHRAHRKMPSCPLHQEWEEITSYFLSL
jgi:hypothetical protein